MMLFATALRRIPRAAAVRRFAALPIVPIIGAFLAKKAVASYAIFEAVHKYGIPKLFRQVAQATRAWGVDAAARREFLYLVKGSLRAPTSAYSFVENSFAARVVAHVAQNPELRGRAQQTRASGHRRGPPERGPADARGQGVRRGAGRPGEGTTEVLNRHVYCVISFLKQPYSLGEPRARVDACSVLAATTRCEVR